MDRSSQESLTDPVVGAAARRSGGYLCLCQSSCYICCHRRTTLVSALAHRVHKLLSRDAIARRDPRQIGHALQRGSEAVDARDDCLPVVRISEIGGGRDDRVQLLGDGQSSSRHGAGAEVLGDGHGGCARQFVVAHPATKFLLLGGQDSLLVLPSTRLCHWMWRVLLSEALTISQNYPETVNTCHALVSGKI